MEFTAPNVSGFTIYGKTGCSYCDKVKDLLTEFKEHFTYVNCDEYLATQRDAFLEFIKEKAGKEYKTFPMVFSSGQFLGGFKDTFKVLIEKEEI